MSGLELYCEALATRRALANARTEPPAGRVELVSPYTDEITPEQIARERKTQILKYNTGLKSQKKTEKYYRAVMGFTRTSSSTSSCPT